MSLQTPRSLATELVLSFPGLLLLGGDQRKILLEELSRSMSFSSLVQWIQSQQPPLPAELPQTGLDQVRAAIGPVLESAAANTGLEGYTWTVQKGLVPGEIAPSDPTEDWSLALGPRAGLAAPLAAYTGADPAMSLTLVNQLPRHLGAYVEFFGDGDPVEPREWESRLPVGVPSTFETSTVKFLGVVAPNTRVAGLSPAHQSETLTWPWPSGADSAQIGLGGLGAGPWLPGTCAVGAFLTFVLDFAVPVVIAHDGGSATAQDGYAHLAADPEIVAEVIAAGEFLLTDASIVDTATLVAALASGLTAMLEGSQLEKLRKALDKLLGKGSVAKSMTAVGWMGQILHDVAAKEPVPAAARLLAADAFATWTLSPNTSIDLRLTVTPDPRHGEWPYDATAYAASLEYAGGFRQGRTGAMPSAPADSPLELAFGSLRNVGPIDITVSVTAIGGALCSSGRRTAGPVGPAAERQLAIEIGVSDRPVKIDSATQYRRFTTLATQGGEYVWKAGGGVAGGFESSVVPERLGITIAEEKGSIGYAWRASGLTVESCDGNSPITEGNLLQSLGTVDPQGALKTLGCAFVGTPALAYSNALACYLDPRQSGWHLRDVDLEPGPFELQQTVSRGRFMQAVDAVAVYEGAFAAALHRSSSTLQILELASAPLADSQAPTARIFGGPGQRTGLLESPQAVALTPNGFILVLERASQPRIQAFDRSGNPAALFDGSPLLDLEQGTGTSVQDLAVSPAGWIYVLSVSAGGSPGPDPLDVYSAAGERLAGVADLQATRIAADSMGRIYALDRAVLTGPTGRSEPAISVWVPAASE